MIILFYRVQFTVLKGYDIRTYLRIHNQNLYQHYQREKVVL